MSHNHVKHIKLGTPQNCPLCKMSNPSGLFLPNECIHCSGTGRIDFGAVDEPMNRRVDKGTLKEAYETIGEWGTNEDDFIAQNFRQFMIGDVPDDNSIELHQFHRAQLQIIVDLGLGEARNQLFTKE